MILNIIVTIIVVFCCTIGMLLMVTGKKTGEISTVMVYLIGNKFFTFGNIVFIAYSFTLNTQVSSILAWVMCIFAVNGVIIDSINWPRIKQAIIDSKNSSEDNNK